MAAIGVALVAAALADGRLVGIVVCHTTTAMRGVHNNQPEEGRAAKIPATEVKLQATTSRRNKRMRGQPTRMPAQ